MSTATQVYTSTGGRPLGPGRKYRAARGLARDVEEDTDSQSVTTPRFSSRARYRPISTKRTLFTIVLAFITARYRRLLTASYTLTLREMRLGRYITC